MRVISGTARGLNLVSPEGLSTRPTLDRVKEALFSMLMPYLRDANVLDLFAGSGALGIEALSRGAEKAVLVDSSRAAAAAVKTNVEKARFTDRAVFVQSDALAFLRRSDESFSVIFIDPPYNGGLYEQAFNLILQRDMLLPGAVMAVEWDEAVHSPIFPPELERIRDRNYGRVHITLLRR